MYANFLLFPATSCFEVSNNKTLLCSGIIQATDTPEEECSKVPKNDECNYQNLSKDDVYTKLQIRGLQYSDPFKTIYKASTDASTGTLIWKNNWTTFLEGMIQMYILGNDIKIAQMPITIRKIVINMKLQKETLIKSRGKYNIQFLI